MSQILLAFMSDTSVAVSLAIERTAYMMGLGSEASNCRERDNTSISNSNRHFWTVPSSDRLVRLLAASTRILASVKWRSNGVIAKGEVVFYWYVSFSEFYLPSLRRGKWLLPTCAKDILGPPADNCITRKRYFLNDPTTGEPHVLH